MRAFDFGFGARNNADIDMGPFVIPEPPRSKQGLTFAERGFSFIRLQPAHLELFAFLYGSDREIPKFEHCIGRTMIDARCLPLGCVLVYFNPSGINELHADFGNWLRTYPTPILRAMKGIADHLRQHEIYYLHAVSDEGIEGSQKLIEWLKGEPTGVRNGDIGFWWLIDLRSTPI
jgi:hypothetical protein